jgi:heme/copper-type cytochrome/quinol oxidase subunit 3
VSAVPGQPVSAIPGEGRAPVAEDPILLANNLRVGVRLLVSGVVFVFVAFAFAFFYLKAVNSNGQWRPPHTSPAAAYGIAILVGVLASSLLLALARRRIDEATGGWRALLALALASGIGVMAVQIIQYTNYGFSPESGGYASVFVGWTALFLVFWFGAVYWMETLLAQALRRPAAPEESELIRPWAAHRPSLDACLIYLIGLAGIAIVTYALLYLVK